MSTMGAVVEAREDHWSVVAFTRSGWETWEVLPTGERFLMELVDVATPLRDDRVTATSHLED